MVSSLSEETKNRRRELVNQRQELADRTPIEQNTLQNIRIIHQDQHVTLGAADGGRPPGRPRRTAGRSGMFSNFICHPFVYSMSSFELYLVSNVGLPNVRVPAAAHGAIPRTVPPQPRPRVSVAQAIRPPVVVRPVTVHVRGTLNRSTAPAQVVPNPQQAGPVMYVARNARLSQVGPRR